MNGFIKLTLLYSGCPVYVNVRHIITVNETSVTYDGKESSCTMVTLTGDTNGDVENYRLIKESAEEVMRLING